MPRRNAELDMSPEQFRELGHRLIDLAADHLRQIGSLPVSTTATPPEVRKAIRSDRGLPETGADPRALLEDAVRLLTQFSLFNGHPKFFGYITSSAAPMGALADLLAGVMNPNLGSWTLAPAATEIELQSVRWIAEFIGFPASCGGLLVSGGNMANFVGFLAARAAKAGWDVRTEGLQAERPRLISYVSKETHTWIQKATDLFGFGTNSIRWIPVDAQQRMQVEDLRKAIADDLARGHKPFLVVGTAGSVSTGAVDPLREIAAVSREHDLWFHVDGAYGAPAAAVVTEEDSLRALSLADSLAVDPHKWLYAPLEAGCALVRNPEHLRNAFSYRPPYYWLNEQVVNLVDYGPQNSRGFRALKVWLMLQQIGREGYIRTISEDIRLSRRFHDLMSRHPQFEPFTQHLSINTFRFVPADLRSGIGSDTVESELNTLNQQLLDRLVNSGETFLSHAVLDGRFALRACIVNFRTSEDDIDAMPDLILRHAGQLSR